MPEKNILIITYYWPPSGGSGVQRWLKFVKYLPQFGWVPYVFTPENPNVPTKDESLLLDVPPEAEVIKLPIWEPYWRHEGGKPGRDKGMKGPFSSKPGILSQLVIWIRGNLLIPDPRRFWKKPSVAFLKDFLMEKQIHTVVTTGPPHSMHLIGLQLKKMHPYLHWIADFRDPWSTWGLLETLKAGKWAMSMHRRLERQVLRAADSVVTITPFYKRQLESLGERVVHYLPNGFDEDDFGNFEWQRPERFVIRHVGIINERCDPRPFMMALKDKCKGSARFQDEVIMEFIGEVHPAFRDYVVEDETLKDICRFTPPVSHQELLQLYRQSALQLLVLHGYKDAAGYLPGKLFEYLATGIPVLGIGPVRGDAAAFLGETRLGEMVDADDAVGILAAIDRFYLWWKSGSPLPPITHREHYSRQHLTRELTKLLR